jgi:hypothetical protein
MQLGDFILIFYPRANMKAIYSQLTSSGRGSLVFLNKVTAACLKSSVYRRIKTKIINKADLVKMNMKITK